jgi:phosphatidylglycerophosphate synthase
VTANQVTLYAVLLSLLAGGSVAAFPEKQWPLLLIPLALLLRMALNAIDGMLAREHDMKSPLGAILNELGDVISDAALYLPLCWVPEISPVWVVSVVLLAIISEMTGVVAVQIGTERRYYATNKVAKNPVNWGIRIRRECLSGFFRESPEAHVKLFLDLDPAPSQRRKRKS